MAHFHYTIMGGLIFAFMAGLYHWLPKMTGLKLNQRLGKIQFWTMFVFFNSTFLPLFAAWPASPAGSSSTSGTCRPSTTGSRSPRSCSASRS
jgi:hypothetical protein